jgi:hypothetical protein
VGEPTTDGEPVASTDKIGPSGGASTLVDPAPPDLHAEALSQGEVHYPRESEPREEPEPAGEALIREARRRARHRHLIVLSIVIGLAGALVAALLLTTGSKVPSEAKGSPASPAMGGGGTLHVSTLRFPGPFVPQQIVSEGGRIWLLGSTKPQRFTDCAIEELNPSTLSTRSFPLPACAADLVAGNGRLFLLTDTFVPHTAATRQLRIEVFDTSSHRAQVLAPVDMTMIGSAIAHQALAYGDGFLWLYGPTSAGKTEVVQISPSTGMALTATSAVPSIGGVFPAVVANAAGLWLAGGPAGGPDLELIRHGSSTPAQIYSGPYPQTSVQWIVGIGKLVWAEVATYGSGPTPTVTLRLLAFDTSGKQRISSPLEETGDFPLVATANSVLWTVGVGGGCNGSQDLVVISGQTGTSHVAASLKSPLRPCLYGANGSQLASVDRSVFVLDPTDSIGGSLLFRVVAPKS